MPFGNTPFNPPDNTTITLTDNGELQAFTSSNGSISYLTGNSTGTAIAIGSYVNSSSQVDNIIYIGNSYYSATKQNLTCFTIDSGVGYEAMFIPDGNGFTIYWMHGSTLSAEWNMDAGGTWTLSKLANINLNNGYSVTIQASSSQTADYTLTLPTTAGTSGYVLSTDGTGVTSWVANGSSGSTVTQKANASDTELTTTTATTIATFTPTTQGNFILSVYYRVVTAATTLTLSAAWDDGTGAQTYTWVNSTSQAVGSYTLTQLYINATTSAAISISATAGTANQVYASGTIISIS